MTFAKRINILTLLARCFARAFFHGKANKIPKNISRVIVVPNSKMGDMIVSTSLFHAIKKAYPDCAITVVGSPINEQILRGNPDVDSYIVWNDDFEMMLSLFKKGRYDFGCVAVPGFLPLAALYLAGIPCIVAPVITNGWSPYETRSYKLIRSFVIKKEHRMRQYVPREYLRLLEPIGIFTDDTTKYIFWSKEANAKITDFISSIEKKYSLLVGILPGAGNKIKQWPTDRFSEVADYLIEKYNAYILILGSELERKEIDEMIASVKNKEWLTECSRFSLDEKKALISKLAMTVSVDTGPIFIAEASGVPTIDIAGSIHPNEMAPDDGKFHLIVKSEGEPQIWTMNARMYDYTETRRQIESITVSMVTEKIDELVDKLKNRDKINNRASTLKE